MTNLTWVIQNDQFTKRGYEDLLPTLDMLGYDYLDVKVVPFTDDFENPVVVSNPVVVLGTHSLCRIARNKGWIPGAYLTENFTYSAIMKHYDVLNSDAQIVSIKDIGDLPNVFFCRPDEDNKIFAGALFTWSEFHIWKDEILSPGAEWHQVDKDTKLVIASPKDIEEEYRFFVVNGEIATASQYKAGMYKYLSRDIPEKVTSFVNEMIGIWVPDECFVIDIAVSNGSPKVNEVNCINCSGFYDIDLRSFLESMQRFILDETWPRR